MKKLHRYFHQLISEFLSGRISRADIANAVTNSIDIDEIDAENEPLLSNCEWAIRHADEFGFYTPDSEFRYLLSCLEGQVEFSPEGRDAAVRARS